MRGADLRLQPQAGFPRPSVRVCLEEAQGVGGSRAELCRVAAVEVLGGAGEAALVDKRGLGKGAKGKGEGSGGKTQRHRHVSGA